MLNIQTGVDTGQTVAIAFVSMNATGLAVNTVDMSTVAGASTAMGLISTAIDTVATQRASVGAAQNRLEATVSNLTSTTTNLTEAKSRIEDVGTGQSKPAGRNEPASRVSIAKKT